MFQFIMLLNVSAKSTRHPNLPQSTRMCLSCFKTDALFLGNNCGPNAVWSSCTDLCPDNCSIRQLRVPICFSLRCGAPGCRCIDGYVSRNDTNTNCIPISQCSKQQPPMLHWLFIHFSHKIYDWICTFTCQDIIFYDWGSNILIW